MLKIMKNEEEIKKRVKEIEEKKTMATKNYKNKLEREENILKWVLGELDDKQ
jgi:hypothetical protein